MKPTYTWQNVREIVENYYSSTFVPNPTTGHIAYLARGHDENVNYIKGRRKGKGKGKGKGKKKETTTKKKERAKEKESKETTTKAKDRIQQRRQRELPRFLMEHITELPRRIT